MRPWLIILTLVIGALGVAPAAQAQPALTDEVMARLERLPGLRGSVTPASFDGRPVLVTFFASWCPPCAAEFSQLREFIEAEGEDEISIIAVNWIEGLAGHSNARMGRMMRLIHPSIPVVLGDQATADEFGGVFSIPAAYIFDPQGNLLFQLGGDRGGHGRHFLSRRQLEQVLGRLG